MFGQVIAMPAAVAAPETDAATRLAGVFDAHHARPYRLARRMSRSAEEAHDAVQETFLRAARRPDSIPMGASPEEAWLVRVLINVCRDVWRKQDVRRRFASEVGSAPIDRGATESELDRKSVVSGKSVDLGGRRII